MAKKLETYGPRSMPLIRSASMTDADWTKAKTEIVKLARSGRGPAAWTAWVRKNLPTCPECGTEKGPFGALSGLCSPCAKSAVKSLLSTLR